MLSNSGKGFKDDPVVSYKVIVINVGPGDATIIQATDGKGRNFVSTYLRTLEFVYLQ